MRNHIIEQIEFRIRVMNKECYDKGSCIKCGCLTTALQMCNKSCDGDCYPEMMSKKDWDRFYTTGYPIKGWTHNTETIQKKDGGFLIIELLMYQNKTKYFKSNELD